MPRTSREEWAKRVERWQDSGLSAQEFCAELGYNPRTLSFYKYDLKKKAAHQASEVSLRGAATGKKAARAQGANGPRKSASTTFVPARIVATRSPDSERVLVITVGSVRFEIPAGFDVEYVSRLLASVAC